MKPPKIYHSTMAGVWVFMALWTGRNLFLARDLFDTDPVVGSDLTIYAVLLALSLALSVFFIAKSFESDHK